MTNNIKSFLVNEKPFDVLQNLLQEGDWWASKLAMHTSTTVQHLSNVIEKAEALDLVHVREEQDGKKLIELTDSGEELARELRKLDRIFKEADNQ